MARIKGYRYNIVEMFPTEDNADVVERILTYDTLKSAQDVLDALNRNNFNFSCYYILMDPVYESEPMTLKEILSDFGVDWNQVEEEIPDPPF